jgi:hypothetical protein
MKPIESIEELETWLTPLYRPPNMVGGHGVDHVQDIIALGPRIARFLDIDILEYRAAAWLHNIDRCGLLERKVKSAGGIKPYIIGVVLAEEFFDLQARERIAEAVARHSERNDAPDFSDLLMALRIADKVVRLVPKNFLDGFAHWAHTQKFDPEHPFDYRKGSDSLWRRFMWNLEWIGMLPSDEARELIDVKELRVFGVWISCKAGVPNTAENEIKKAAGKYYYSMIAPR